MRKWAENENKTTVEKTTIKDYFWGYFDIKVKFFNSETPNDLYEYLEGQGVDINNLFGQNKSHVLDGDPNEGMENLSTEETTEAPAPVTEAPTTPAPATEPAPVALAPVAAAPVAPAPVAEPTTAAPVVAAPVAAAPQEPAGNKFLF